MSIEKKSIDTMRVLIADTVQKAKSGHPGMAIGSSPLGYALWKTMRHDPKDPKWQGRDRFILSAGHVSALEYTLLHLFGYGVSMDDMKSFRQWESLTPGHPELNYTPGVEATSGPLGQGIAMAVGMALAESRLAAEFNRDGFPVVDNYTFALCGDGCLQEGVSAEAASFAGQNKLSKLVVLYDRNKITIEGSTDLAFSEDVGARFESYGWHVQTVEDGEDVAAIVAAIEAAKAEKEKPSFIIVKTEIARGTKKQGLSSSHGEPLGDEVIADMKERLGWTLEPFTVPEDVYAHFAELAANCAKDHKAYDEMFAKYGETYPELLAQWNAWHETGCPEGFKYTEKESDEKAAATRAASGDVLNELAGLLPNLFGGSADLGPSNKSEIKGKPFYSPAEPTGANIHFGIREFAMAAICNGIAIYGGLRPYCATFMVFTDYLKPALRMGALMELPVLYIMTHDSIGVGEDGPTHQPIEHLATLRAIPDTLVFRPADARETRAAYIAALESGKPAVMALSRQNLPAVAGSGEGVKKGGYIVRKAEKAQPDVIIMASGSELQLAVGAADVLKNEGIDAQVVSMACVNLFDAQSDEYKEEILPSAVRARVAVEAATSYGWHKYVGLDGEFVTIDHFGASAPANVLFEKFGFTVENVCAAAKKAVAKAK